MPSKLNFLDPQMALIVWNDAYQDAGFDGPVEDVPLGEYLQQTTIGFIISENKRHIKFCNEFCPENKHVRNYVCLPKKYVVSITPLQIRGTIDTSNLMFATSEPHSKKET